MGSGSPGAAMLPGAMCPQQRPPSASTLQSRPRVTLCNHQRALHGASSLSLATSRERKSNCKPVLKSRHQAMDGGGFLTTRVGEWPEVTCPGIASPLWKADIT